MSVVVRPATRGRYVLGNLVGLGNPLTDVGPETGHIFAEVIDLLIAVWSLTLAGLVIGAIGSLAWVETLTRGADGSITHKFSTMMGFAQEARKLAADPSGLDYPDFVALCADRHIEMDDAEMKRIFVEADTNKNGTIDRSEVERLIERVQLENGSRTRVQQLGMPGTADNHELLARMDAIERKLERLLNLHEGGALGATSRR